MIKRLLRWRGDESLDLYARVNDEDWASWIAKSLHASVDSTVASRFKDMDFSPEVQARFNEIAKAMLALNASTARAAAISPLRNGTRADQTKRNVRSSPPSHPPSSPQAFSSSTHSLSSPNVASERACFELSSSTSVVSMSLTKGSGT